MKTVLRERSLRAKPGPCIANELDVLLPGIYHEHGTGAGLPGVVSQQWGQAQYILISRAALTRDQRGDYCQLR